MWPLQPWLQKHLPSKHSPLPLHRLSTQKSGAFASSTLPVTLSACGSAFTSTPVAASTIASTTITATLLTLPAVDIFSI
jgi:hypothetical protein